MAHDDEDDSMDGSDSPEPAAEILLVGEEESARLIAESLEADGHHCTSVVDSAAAKRRVLEIRFDLIVLDLDALGGRAFEVVQLAARLSPASLCILRSRAASVETVVAAMRAGIGDYFVGALSVPQLRVRMRAAVRRARAAKGRLERVARLASLCRSLVAKRGEGPREIEALAELIDQRDDALAEAAATAIGTDADSSAHADEETDHLEGTDASSPLIDDSSVRGILFDELASQHLDPEQLITASIEYLVGELGAVNTAVFLGTGNCRFGLAAYARADLPRAAIESALARWSDEVCPMAAADGRVQRLPDGLILADTLARHEAIVVPCRHAGACDAVFILLPLAGVRTGSRSLEALATFADSFAQQLDRIQRIHARYRPGWPPESD